jgi:signal transduction histidine kinase
VELLAIARECERMGRLVTDLLALARADAGQVLARRPLMLDTLLVDVYQQARYQAPQVKLTIGDLEQVEMLGDADRLKQLLLNLVDNACRYTPAGGTVTLGLVERDGLASLLVSDTGSGIPPEDLPHIFERFYRADHARNREIGGTGLGLAISQVIAEAHGGRIEVESEVGVGSTFTVHLPTRTPDLATRKTAAGILAAP